MKPKVNMARRRAALRRTSLAAYRRFGAKGGLARAAKLSKRRLSQIGKHAVTVRELKKAQLARGKRGNRPNEAR